jgi:hypothetical protein
MDDIWMRVMENMSDRINGPMKFRFILQPVMASVFAIIAGVKDAKSGKPPYFWALLSQPEHRTEMLKDGWKSVGKIFLLALVLDMVFQIMVLKTVYPLEAIVVAILLAFVPYLLLRGLVTRLMN